MPAQTLQDLYARKLQALWSAEQQIKVALPLMMQRTTHPELRRAFEQHLAETEEQSHRLEALFRAHGGGPGAPCEAMEGIVRENMLTAAQITDADTLDAALLAGAQSVEHYEIAGYGTARAWARQLGRTDEAEILERTLREEEQTDRLLTQLAESMINREAVVTERQVVPPVVHGDHRGTSPMTAMDRRLLEEGPERHP